VKSVCAAAELTLLRLPGCGCSVPLNTSRLPLLMESGKALGPRSLRKNAKESNPNGTEQDQVDATFLLTTTPRYWEKRIKMLEICKQQENLKPQINPYTVKDKIVTRRGGPMHGWAGLPHGYAPASQHGLSAYELPVPRKPGALISRQMSFGSTRSAGTSPRSLRGTSTVLRDNSNATVDMASSMPNPLARQSSSWSLFSPPRENSLASLKSEWSWLSAQSKISVAPGREHMLHGHEMPNKRWRQNSTFKEMAKMRLALEAPELVTSQEIMDKGINNLKDNASNDFQTRHRTESRQRMSFMHEGTEALTQDLRDLEAVEDLLEIRRDSSGGWYLPNGRCLHWTESQIRAEMDRKNAEILHEQQFGVKSLAYRWRRLSVKVINAMVSKRIRSIMADNFLSAILTVQKGAVRFLRIKRARDARARQWAKLHAAATKIQALVRGITDRQYATFVGKCKPFLDRNANVFATHKAFVRAKRVYTGTIEPPATATAFAFMGDANSATDKEDLILTFVEFCHAINDHLRQAVLDPVLAQRTSSALNRANSGLMFGRMSSFGRIDSAGSGASQMSGMPQRTTSTVNPAANDSIKPFEPSQEHVLLMAESTARLLYLYDDTRLGLLSERDFWSACREIHLSTGVQVSRDNGKWALRYTRGQGGIALNMLCALQEIARSSDLPKSGSVTRLTSIPSSPSP